MPMQIQTGSVQGTGSEYLLVVNPDGSINTVVTGSIMIGSVSATVDSVYIQSGANIDLGSAWKNIGSVVVSNFNQVGSVGIQNITGSVAQITDPWRVTGSVNSFGTGSMRVSEWGITTPITTTGSFTSYGVGSFIGSVYQLTSPWIVLGSVQIYGRSGADVYPLLVTSGTYARLQVDINSIPTTVISGTVTVDNRVAGSIVNMPIVGVSGTSFAQVWTGVGSVTGQVTIGTGSIQTYNPVGIGSIRIAEQGITLGVSGIVNQGTNPWIISGTANISGAVGVLSSAGSIGIYAGANTVFGVSGTVIGVSGGTFLVNRTSLISDVYTASSGVTTNLSGNALPNGYNLTIKAFSTNTDYIGIGSKTTLFAQSGLKLYPDDSVRIGLDNTNRISFVPRVTGEGIEVFVET